MQVEYIRHLAELVYICAQWVDGWDAHARERVWPQRRTTDPRERERELQRVLILRCQVCVCVQEQQKIVYRERERLTHKARGPRGKVRLRGARGREVQRPPGRDIVVVYIYSCARPACMSKPEGDFVPHLLFASLMYSTKGYIYYNMYRVDNACVSSRGKKKKEKNAATWGINIIYALCVSRRVKKKKKNPPGMLFCAGIFKVNASYNFFYII